MSQFHGNGILEFKDGSCLYGKFKNGYPIGEINYEDLKSLEDFGIKKYQDAIYRG